MRRTGNEELDELLHSLTGVVPGVRRPPPRPSPSEPVTAVMTTALCYGRARALSSLLD